MARLAEEIADTDRFEALYGCSTAPVMQAVANAVCGCGYVGTSWTTRDEALATLRWLGLGRSSSLLELGAGAGWPGLLLAQRSGCRVTLLDLPETALRIAATRAETDGIAERVDAVVADAAAIPFGPGAFTAINHSDLLCCLVAKEAVLAECRRVIAASGRMTFSVIAVAPGLSAAERREAIANAPVFVEAERDYGEMLARAGWRLLERWDVTDAYEHACRRMAAADERFRPELLPLLGAEEMALRKAKWRGKLAAIRRRLTLREIFLAAPAR